MTSRILDVVESQKFVEAYGIRFSPSGVAKNENEAVAIANKLGYPVVMKVISPQAVHKTDVQGVRVGIDDDYEVREAYKRIHNSVKSAFPNAKIKGMQIQRQEAGYEVIVGGKRDPQFGPVIMFGLGGVLVEILGDISVRICPITKKDALEMIHELRAYPMLTGFRGRKAANLDAIVNVLLKVSNMLIKEKKLLELDLNPMFAGCKGIIGADARVILQR